MGHIGPHVTNDGAAFIHPTATLHGTVHLAKDSSVWANVVTRAEMLEIRIGARTNIQDFVMIHVGYDTPTVVGEDCSITHHATLHGCEIGDRVLVGINATIMDGVTIGDDSIVAGNAICVEGSQFPANSIIAGVPAKVVATRDSGRANRRNARFYLRNAQNYARGVELLSEDDLAWIAAEDDAAS